MIILQCIHAYKLLISLENRRDRSFETETIKSPRPRPQNSGLETKTADSRTTSLVKPGHLSF